MEVSGEGYRVWVDPRGPTVSFQGSLRLVTQEYEPISELLMGALAGGPKSITLDLTELVFLNSSGINALYKFAITLRNRGDVHLIVRASAEIGWQAKSLPNIKRFFPTAELV